MMVDEVITKQELIDAKRDAHDLGDSVNEKKIIHPRYGAPYRSIPLVVENIENTINEWDAAVKTITQEGGIPDLAVSTWSGRTQEEKNKENPSTFDFEAKGDGVTNDTQAFIELETEYQGQVIDLLGKTYLVDGEFNKNQYENGYFRFTDKLLPDHADTAIISRNKQSSECDLSFANHQRNGQQLARINQAIQGAVLDEQSNTLYTLVQVSGSHTDFTETNKVVAYSWSGAEVLSPIWETLPSNQIGHQSLGLAIGRYGYRNTAGILQLWSLGGSDLTTNRGKYAVRFTPVPNETPVVEKFKLFDDSFYNRINTLCVNPQGTRLVMTGKKAHFDNGVETTRVFARVFDMNVFIAGEGDYSDQYLTEFEIANYQRDLQDCASDGKYLYLIFAGSAYSSTQKYLVVYTLGGEFVSATQMVAGGDRAWYIYETLGGDILFEPEALFFVKSAFGYDLVIANTNGTPSGATHRETSFYSTRFNQAMQLIGRGEVPALILKGTNNIATSDGDFRVGVIDGSGNFTTHLKLTSGGIELVASDSEAKQFIAQNSLRRVNFHVANSGIAGIYDHTNSKWIIRSNLNGEKASILSDLNISVSKVFADNTTAKAGGLVNGDVYRTSTGQLMIVF